MKTVFKWAWFIVGAACAFNNGYYAVKFAGAYFGLNAVPSPSSDFTALAFACACGFMIERSLAGIGVHLTEEQK